jgi:OOP family OmpA-OmpF porin
MKSRNRSSTKAPFALKLSAAAALLAIMHMAPAAAVEGYVTSRYDHQPVRSGTGTCIHDYGWQAGMRFADCEPAPIQPVVVAPAVQPEQEPPLAEAPAPQPIAIARQVPFELSMDELFDFDSASLKPEGRAALDALVNAIASSSYASVAIVGHADRIGAAAYNQQLSERRAQALRDYLVGDGIEAQKISARGVGSSEPVTSKADCAGAHGARLIQCLQPDRYAEVTVDGSMLQVSFTSGNATQ